MTMAKLTSTANVPMLKMLILLHDTVVIRGIAFQKAQ
jgi:hypothetical protein